MAETVEGLTTIPSRHSVDETVVNIVSLLRDKGIKLFAVVDHSGEATQAGLKMPSTRLLIFGNPKAGTPLMLKAPSAAIDLPLKLLVAEDGAGKVTISYNSAEYLGKRHHLPAEMQAVLAGVAALAKRAAE